MAVLVATIAALAAWVALRTALATRFPAPSKDERAQSRRGRDGDRSLGSPGTRSGNGRALDGRAGRTMGGLTSGSRAGRHPAQAVGSRAAGRAIARLSTTAAALVPVSRAATDRLRLRLSQAGVPVPASVFYGASVTAVACGFVLALVGAYRYLEWRDGELEHAAQEAAEAEEAAAERRRENRLKRQKSGKGGGRA